MLILVIGQGAREHAIVHSLLQSNEKTQNKVQVVCAPGNPGIASVAKTAPVNPIDGTDVVSLAKDLKADLVVIGPEAPLVAGVADDLRANGFAVFGPSKAAAQLEGSKAFAKAVMKAAGVPTAPGHRDHPRNRCRKLLAPSGALGSGIWPSTKGIDCRNKTS